MDRKRNLYKLDDICLFLSAVLGLLFLFQFRSLLPLLAGSDLKALRDGAWFLVQYYPFQLGLLLFSAVFLQLIGRSVRSKEKLSLKVIDAISYRSRVTVPGLSAELGIDENRLEKVAKQLAELPGAGVTYDGNYIRLVKPDTSSPGFGADHFKRPAASKPVPDANPAQKAAHDHLKLPEREIPLGKSQDPFSINPAKTASSGKPNPVILIILFFVFWPAAVVYGMSFYMKNVQKKAIQDKIKNLQSR